MKYIKDAPLNDMSDMIGDYIKCDICGTKKAVVNTSVTNLRFDPTEVYHLQCGHKVI